MILPLEKDFDPKPIDSFVMVLTCPACGTSGAGTIGRAAAGWGTDVAGRMFWHPDYDVKYCDACGLYFKNRVLNKQALADYYRLLPFESFESSELFPTDRLILRSIQPGHPDAKILDFGCGVGRILERLTVRHRCYGVEVNERAREIARAKGITILPESAVYSHTECNFDFVILSDVFEHLPNPLRFLRMLTILLKPGGGLIISTGNGDAVRCQEYLSQFWYFRAPGHLQMLSPKHLEWCAGKLGLRVTDCETVSHYKTSLLDRYRQYTRAWLFEQFHLRPCAWVTRTLRFLPLICRAEHWPLAPAITCTRDHLVAVLRKD